MKVRTLIRKISTSHTYIEVYIDESRAGKLLLGNREFAILCRVFSLATRWVPGFEFRSEDRVFKKNTTWQQTAVAEN